MKTFQAFKREGIQFLAVQGHQTGEVSIVDDLGNNYGAYNSIESFEEFAERNGGFLKQQMGKVSLTIRTVQTPLPVS
jgi:hypothetical protein